MTIEESDFRLTPINDSSPFFDLELLDTIRPKGKEARQEFKNAAYGIKLETALRMIAHRRICNKYPNDSISMQTYLDEFKEEIKSLKALCGN